MHNIYDYTLEELQNIFQPPYKAQQIYSWLYHRYIEDFNVMSNVSKETRQILIEQYSTQEVQVAKVEISTDGSKKYLFKTSDGHSFEAVFLLMKDHQQDMKKHYTICLSSQIGCKVGCAFCLTARGGLIRNLSAGEIVFQVVSIKRDNHIPKEKGINIVFMGMGEPLDNFENLIKAIHILSCKNGLDISPKRQTISTSGIAPKIQELGQLNLGVQLALSLHAVDDTLRSKLIPMNKHYNIQEIIKSLRMFPINSRKRLMFEYLMIDEVNDDIKSARSLLRLLNGFKAKVNLILFNPYEKTRFKRPKMEKVRAFQEFLLQHGLLCTIRESKGLDISAACGQLREQECIT